MSLTQTDFAAFSLGPYNLTISCQDPHRRPFHSCRALVSIWYLEISTGLHMQKMSQGRKDGGCSLCFCTTKLSTWNLSCLHSRHTSMSISIRTNSWVPSNQLHSSSLVTSNPALEQEIDHSSFSWWSSWANVGFVS